MKINILGTEWEIFDKSPEQDAYLKCCDGYCDKTTRTMVIKTESSDSELGNFAAYRRKVLRHEIIHAFLYESGLHENFKHEQWGHDETMVDWIAAQFPKLLQAFKDAGCVES